MDALKKHLNVIEIFRSIQGESTWAGAPCTFIRLAGCNLRCEYCDTAYAFEVGRTMEIGAILRACEPLAGSVVEITGGEPLIQKECGTLAACLLECGATVLLETNGTEPIEHLPKEVIKIVDIKCPGSGCSEHINWSNIDHLSDNDEVKFVIGDRSDFEWSCEVVDTYRLTGLCKAVLFAPVYGKLAPDMLADWILESELPVRLQIQLQKYIWDPQTRGV